ncbi:MAG TPA: PAS domain S-box protein, partial [Flavisolibacter sp.]|nr:PAS domain S-box protein [Flavisolibacter sp.]
TLVQNGNDFIGIIDEKGNYLFVTANLKEHLGFQPDDLIGKNALQLIHHDDVAMVTQALQDMQHRTTMLVGPFRFKDGFGNWRWMETTVTNHLANPAIGGLVINSRDITEKKQKEDELKRSEQQFKALVRNSSDLIVIMDENARFNYVSENVSMVLGYQVEEMLGKNALDFINPEDIPKVASEIESLVANGKADGVVHRFLHKTRGWIWLESKGSNHLENECIQGILVNARNIDDRVKLQDRLQQEMVNKQKEITAAAIKAQEAQRSQLGLELHDNVNQVLTTVKLYNEMFLTGLVQDKEVLVKSTQYIQDCINEIRSISKRLSAPTLGKISLRDSISELVDSINLTKRLTINYLPQFIDLCPISQDLHLAIYRIVQEGLNNIIKYAGAQKATVEIIRSNDGITLVIADDGKGFDMRSGSTGIGITNMKTRAENMNGSFTIESAPGKGCRIEIVFPVIAVKAV